METSGHDQLQFDSINAALDQEAEVERMIEIGRGYGMLIKEVPDHLAQLQKYEEREFNGVIQDGTECGHGRVLRGLMEGGMRNRGRVDSTLDRGRHHFVVIFCSTVFVIEG